MIIDVLCDLEHSISIALFLSQLRNFRVQFNLALRENDRSSHEQVVQSPKCKTKSVLFRLIPLDLVFDFLDSICELEEVLSQVCFLVIMFPERRDLGYECFATKTCGKELSIVRLQLLPDRLFLL